jgi:carbonic anhydrase
MLRLFALAISAGVVFSTPQLYQDEPTWSGECATGLRQSPIHLDSSMIAEVHAPIDFRNYFNGHFNKHLKGSIINNGISVVWNVNPDHHFKLSGGKMWTWKNPSIRDGPFGGVTHTHAYYLWKIEFHWGEPGNPAKGSEHTIDGEMSPLEMQMVHVEDRYIGKMGEVDWKAAQGAQHGVAILSILFYVDNKKPMNQEPLSEVDDMVWEINWPGSGRRKRSTDAQMSLDEIEEAQLEYDHELNLKSLQYAFDQLKVDENAEETHRIKRDPHMKRMKLTLNVGAFIRKAIRNGRDKTMSTYWTYKGSLTTPSCKEAVTWVIFQRQLPIAQVQANAFSSLYCNNYRPARAAAPEHELKYLIHNCLHCNCHCNV